MLVWRRTSLLLLGLMLLFLRLLLVFIPVFENAQLVRRFQSWTWRRRSTLLFTVWQLVRVFLILFQFSITTFWPFDVLIARFVVGARWWLVTSRTKNSEKPKPKTFWLASFGRLRLDILHIFNIDVTMICQHLIGMSHHFLFMVVIEFIFRSRSSVSWRSLRSFFTQREIKFWIGRTVWMSQGLW